MEIKTKFNIGQEVYILDDGIIQEDFVETIIIDREGITYTFENSEYDYLEDETFGDEVFATLKEAVAKLKEKE